MMINTETLTKMLKSGKRLEKGSWSVKRFFFFENGDFFWQECHTKWWKSSKKREKWSFCPFSTSFSRCLCSVKMKASLLLCIVLVSYVVCGDVEIGKPAPFFKNAAIVNGEIEEVSLTDYKGKWLVVFFYPLDWTFVCPTEILDFSDSAKQFRAEGVEVIGVSVDSVYSHLAWIATSRAAGGLGGSLNIPLVSDLNHKMSEDYGALYLDAGHTLRATYIIDPEGIVRHVSKNDPPVGRSVPEVLRIVQGYQYVAEHGEVCPVGWRPGQPTIIPDPEKKLSFFEERNANKEDCRQD